MIKIKRKESPKTKAVYTKYLGEDYDFEDQTYSLITSNHIGFFDVMVVWQKGLIVSLLIVKVKQQEKK